MSQDESLNRETSASDPESTIPMQSFLDAVEARFSIRLIETLRNMQGTEAVATTIVQSFTDAIENEKKGSVEEFERVINALTSRRDEGKLARLRALLEKDNLGTPLTTRIRNKLSYVLEQTVDVVLIDELTQAILTRFRSMVPERS